MDMKKDWGMRFSGILLIALGALLGGSWAGYCFGDRIFTLAGIPAWSNGTAGTHYPGIIGFLVIIAGVGLIHVTLKGKTRVLV